MAKFRKKPVVIEAHQWNPQEKPTALPDWLSLQAGYFREELRVGRLTPRPV